MCDDPLRVKTKEGDFAAVPCGRCPPCLKRRVNEWVFRLQEEDKVSSCSHFVTLTYDPSFVPISPHRFMTLAKADVQYFFKRLRKLIDKDPRYKGTKLKYYLAGEYGSESDRPHYHIILFNLPDVEFFGYMQDGKGKTRRVLRSKLLTAAWVQRSPDLPGYLSPLGGIDIGDVSGASISYTCKYISKPKRIPMFDRDDRVREFSLMSKGLGLSYLTPYAAKFHTTDLSNNYVRSGIYKIPLPRIYRDRLLDDFAKRDQRFIINKALEDFRVLDERTFYEMYGHRSDFTYYDYLDSQRMARSAEFLRNNLPRDF